MTTNDEVLLQKFIERRRADVAPDLTVSDYMEFFVAESVLKEHGLSCSYEELQDGVVDGGGDGGIDAVYTFLNGDPVDDETNFASYRRDVRLDIFVLQAKTSSTFKEVAVDKMRIALTALLDLSISDDDLRTKHALSDAVIGAFRVFKNALETLSTAMPRLSIELFYATRATDTHPNVEAKRGVLREAVQRMFPSASVQATLLGASQLLNMARSTAVAAITLKLAENPISSEANGFACLVRLDEYFRFITDEQQRLRTDLFESNVRDYGRSQSVNREIRESLSNKSQEDFWWLNNGVTIVASDAQHSGKSLTIKTPQIVNGLQTSHEIFEHIKGAKDKTDARNVLVRVLVSDDLARVDRIIKATNSQTQVSPASLRATEKIQRDVEEELLSKELFYDRRRNYYKNMGRPASRIVSVKLMAQSVVSILHLRPHEARAQPSQLLQKQDKYDEIFSAAYPIGLYSVCPMMVREVERHMRSFENVESRVRLYLRFHVAAVAAARLTTQSRPTAVALAGLDITKVEREMVKSAFVFVYEAYHALGNNDRVAKSVGLTDQIKSGLADFVAA